MPKKLLNITQRLNKMSPAQQRRIFALRNRITKCEGIEMPYKYWCESCKTTWQKLNDVFIKFEKMNGQRSLEHTYDNTFMFGSFSEPDSTEDRYND